MSCLHRSKTMYILLSSLLLLYFQLTVPSYSKFTRQTTSQSKESSHDKDKESSQDKDSTRKITTINKLGHILNADSPHKTSSSTSSDTALQDEISKLQEPDYLLIGVVKSGSTSLYHYMVQHPQITGVESQYLLPDSMRNKISTIIKKRRIGKIPRISKPKITAKQIMEANNNGIASGSKTIKTIKAINPQTRVKQDIYEINNFDLARMIKPIIDQKEVRFFDSFWYNHLQTVTNHSLLLGWKWYLNVFNQQINSKTDDILRGEASPTYFASSQFTAERIKLWLPNVKLILLLRNPVRRFVSHLKMIKENHAANMRFRKQRQIDLERQRLKSNNANNANTAGKAANNVNNINHESNGKRVLLETKETEQYNPFNSAFQANTMNNYAANSGINNMNAMGYNAPFKPQTRYGRGRNNNMNRRKSKKNRGPLQRFMRTRAAGRGKKQSKGKYQQLLNEIQDEIDDLDEDDIDELDEDDVDFDIDVDDDDVNDHEHDEYINNEIQQNELQRNAYKKMKNIPTNPLNDHEINIENNESEQEDSNEQPNDINTAINMNKPSNMNNMNKQTNKGRKPVNKMEKIIGSIYKLSMYQVILVSNANPDSNVFYQKRWGIDRDVAGFINRLLFGGIYTMRMKEWLKRFDSKHLFYRESSELFDNPVQLMNDLELFLDVDAFGDEKWRNITAKVYNVELEKGKGYQHREVNVQEIEHWDITVEKETKIPHPTENRKWQSLEIIDKLKDYYRPHNGQLSNLFDGKKYKNWDY